MKQINIPLSSPISKETTKVSNLLPKTPSITSEDLRGLTWIFFEEGV